MIDWLIQSAADDSQVAAGTPPAGLLSGPETAVFNGLHSPKRRQDWLLGRWTAKRLLRTVQSQGRFGPTDSNISILAAADGAPEVWLGPAERLQRRDVALSISHSHGTALCAVAGANVLLGADIERIEVRPARFVSDYFSPEEQRRFGDVAPELRECWVTAVWSAKEAVLKALHEGLRMDTRFVSCEFQAPFAAALTWQPFAVRVSSSRARRDVQPLQGWWRLWHDFVLTLAVGAKSGLLGAPAARH